MAWWDVTPPNDIDPSSNSVFRTSGGTDVDPPSQLVKERWQSMRRLLLGGGGHAFNLVLPCRPITAPTSRVGREQSGCSLSSSLYTSRDEIKKRGGGDPR